MPALDQAAVAESSESGSLIDLLTARAPRDVVLRRKQYDRWVPVTVCAFLDEIRMVAKGVAASGVQPGDRVGVMASPSYECALVDYAIWHAGGVAVPLDERASSDEVEWILSDSGAVALFLASPQQRQVFDRVAPTLPQVRGVWQFEDDDWIYALAESGELVGDDDLDSRLATLDRASPAMIVYESAAQESALGCTLTHGNLLDAVEALTAALPDVFAAGGSALLGLASTHTFGLAVQLAGFRAGVVLGHCNDPANLSEDLAAFQPTFLPTLPHILESIFNQARTASRADGTGTLFDLATECAIAYSRSLDARGPDARLRLRRAVYDRLVFGGVRAAFGGQVTHVLTGSEPLGERLGHYLRGIGVRVLEGYGLTETSSTVAVNDSSHARIGSAGRALPGTQIRVSPSSEVQVRGPGVFAGYWNNDVATKEVLDPDGWLATGDVGGLDEDGYLWITGRRSDLIATEQGENIAPAAVEERVRSHFLVSRCMVVGEDRPFLVALVTIDPNAFRVWLATARLPTDIPLAQVVGNLELRGAIQAAVDDANRSAPPFESIRAFAILERDFSAARGELRPSGGLRRAMIRKLYAQSIEALYG